MNCQQIQDLLPLYVGNELEVDRARLVAAHVHGCETCSGTAREYRATRQLIQTFAPPAFTEDFYAEMRQSVWQNVEKKSPSPAFFSIVTGLFSPRLAWTLATAVLLIAISAVGIYMISRRSVPQSIVSQQPPASTTPQRTSSPSNKSSASSLALNGSNSRRESVGPPQLRQKRKSISDRVNLAAVPKVTTVSPVTIAAPVLDDSRQPDRGVSDVSLAPLRVEIQTKNPNIRIIWFAPRDAKQPSSNSKGI